MRLPCHSADHPDEGHVWVFQLENLARARATDEYLVAPPYSIMCKSAFAAAKQGERVPPLCWAASCLYVP